MNYSLQNIGPQCIASSSRRLKRWAPILGFLAAVTIAGAVDVVPDAGRPDWSKSGVPGGIPQRGTIYTTLNPGATSTQIQSAINSCPAGQVVFLNAGTYSLSGGIRITR